MAELYLNVGGLCAATRANGPGLRAAVWVQGCTLACRGCFNTHLHPHEAQELWAPEELARTLLQPGIEGITILGGEPFQQAMASARLAHAVHSLGASVVTYSGYPRQVLERSVNPAVQQLWAASDLLIVGPFLRDRRSDGSRWRGSTNQEFVFNTSRYSWKDVELDGSQQSMEFHLGDEAFWTGIPPEAWALGT